MKMSELVVIWKEAKEARINAQKWNALPDGKKYQTDKFDISLPHCTLPMLNRAGQQKCGGQNFWKTEKLFNRAILEYLINDWKDIFPQVIKRMCQAEEKALIECQTYVDELQANINEVKHD